MPRHSAPVVLDAHKMQILNNRFSRMKCREKNITQCIISYVHMIGRKKIFISVVGYTIIYVFTCMIHYLNSILQKERNSTIKGLENGSGIQLLHVKQSKMTTTRVREQTIFSICNMLCQPKHFSNEISSETNPLYKSFRVRTKINSS